MAQLITSVSTGSVLDLYARNTPAVIDPLQVMAADMARVSRIVTGKRGKIGGIILTEPQWVEMGAKELCWNNAVSDSPKSSAFSFQMCHFESRAKVCPADLLEAICGNESQGTLASLVYNQNLQNIGQGKTLGTVLSLYLTLHLQRLRKDGILQRTFGAKAWNAATTTTAGFRHNLNGRLTSDYINNFLKGNLGKCDSLWGSLYANAGTGANNVKIVDSNGSAAATKFLNPQYTTDYADSLINSLDITVRMPSKVVFFIDPALFDSLYVAIGQKLQYTNDAVRFVESGTAEIDILRYKGYNFVKFTTSETLDYEADAMVTTNVPGRGLVTHSANLRGMALSEGNVMVGLEVVEQEVRGAAVQVKMLEEDGARGIFTIESLIARGVGLIEPKLCTISYASNATFA